MDPITGVAELRQISLSLVEQKLLRSYKDDDSTAISIIHNYFKEKGAMHLLYPNIGPSNKPLLRLFNTVDTNQKAELMKDFSDYDLHFSRAWYEKSAFFEALKEACFVYAADATRKHTEKYVCLTSNFRSKVLKNFDCHMCSNWLTNSSANSRVVKQLEYFKTFKLATQEVNMRHGIGKFFTRAQGINPDYFCSNPDTCDVDGDTIIVDHMENYITVEQVLLNMKQHNATKAIGYLLFPDGVNYKTKGNFYNGSLYFDRTKNSFNDVDKPIIFYDKHKVFEDCVYPWKEYQKFFKTTQIIFEGNSYRYEIVKRMNGVLFYTIHFDGVFDSNTPTPKYNLMHREECYKVTSFRPKNNVFGKNFNNFEKVSAFVPKEIFVKCYDFGLTLGAKDMNRANIHERLCTAFMRVQNAATGAITQFDKCLTAEEVEITADVIWMLCFLKRRQRSEIFASQKEINNLLGDFGLNIKTFKNYLNEVTGDYNPFKFVAEYFSNKQEEFYEKEWAEYMPNAINMGPYTVYGGREHIIDVDKMFNFFGFNFDFIPPWFKLLQKLKFDGEDDTWRKKYNKIMDTVYSDDSDKYKKITHHPFFSFMKRDRPDDGKLDDLRFFTDEIVVLHDEPLLTAGDRQSLLDRLNLVTDALVPTLTRVSVLKEVNWFNERPEPSTFHPLVPLKDVVTSVKMAVEYVSNDAPPLIDSRFDYYDTHYNDLDISIDADVKFNTFKRKFIPPSSFLAENKIMSYITKARNPPSYKNTFLGFNKRNWNVPILEDVTEQLDKIHSTVENMFNCLFTPGWKSILENEYGTNPMKHFFDTNSKYVHQLVPGKAKRFDLDEMVPMELWTTNRFKQHTNILKSDTKFGLNGEIQSEYTVNATINFHDLEVNAVSSSLFRNVVTRLKALMRPEVCMMIEKDRPEIEEFYFKNMEKVRRSSDPEAFLSLEIDYSKFDKSQQERCAMIEMYIYARLGLNEEFAAYWFEGLKDMTTINYHDMIKSHLEWQRRTGTATTALGNTLVTMATVCAVLFPDFDENSFEAPFICGAFLGDDSSIIINQRISPPGEISEKLNTWFNLSAKFDIKNHIYFCSSFVVYLPGKGCKMIPDPKKRILALTKPLIASPEEVFVSLRDSCRAYLEDQDYMIVLAQGVHSRYNIDFENALFTCRALTTVLSNVENFTKLYDFSKTTIYG